MQANKFVFEIGCEEIPAQYVAEMAQSFLNVTKNMFEENLLSFENAKVFHTPRRLTVIIESLANEQKVVAEEVKGPSEDRLFDDSKNPTPALMGFLKKNNKTIEDIFYKEIKGVKYAHLSISNIARKTSEVLKEILPKIISKIYLPNAMRWNDFKFKFVRPIRWILALFGNEVIDFEIECCKSGNFTKGHRTLSNSEIIVGSATEYEKVLKDNFIILDSAEREKSVLNQIQNIEKENACKVLVEEDLLDEIVNLVEYPTCGIGNYPKEFLNLPDPVVITPMQDHQRYFPIYKDNKLTNSFVFVRNGDSENLSQVAHGNERVLNARLKDGEFFYNEDIKTTLEEKAKKLNQVLYQEKLGSMVDKSERVNRIAKYLANICGYEEIEKINKTTLIMKADLVSMVVNEFPELQGVMGGIYAKKEGVDEDVANAISEQYLPTKSGGELPNTLLGAIIAIADKLDGIMGLSAVGLMGKGSNDPYGMRRQALGILAIQQKFNLDLDITKIINDLALLYVNFLKEENINEVQYVLNLQKFFEQRMKGILIDDNQFTHNIVEQIPFDSLNIFSIITKANLLNQINDNEKFNSIKQSFLRIEKILKNKEVVVSEFDSSLIVCDDERSMINEYFDIRNDYNQLLKVNDFENAIFKLQKLGALINTFFDNNLVMSEDIKVQNNRIFILSEILKFYKNIFIFA